jgi:hypothetical protein
VQRSAFDTAVDADCSRARCRGIRFGISDRCGRGILAYTRIFDDAFVRPDRGAEGRAD